MTKQPWNLKCTSHLCKVRSSLFCGPGHDFYLQCPEWSTPSSKLTWGDWQHRPHPHSCPTPLVTRPQGNSWLEETTDPNSWPRSAAPLWLASTLALLALTVLPISPRSPSWHPARPPGPLHGAVHKVSGSSFNLFFSWWLSASLGAPGLWSASLCYPWHTSENSYKGRTAEGSHIMTYTYMIIYQ